MTPNLLSPYCDALEYPAWLGGMCDCDSQRDRIRDTEPTVSIIAAVQVQAGGMFNSVHYS